MKTKKNWKPMISIVGLMLIMMMMTAVSVCAEDPITRDNQPPDDVMITEYTDENESNNEPNLISPGDNDETTSDLPDYQNYTGDMLISPGPEANSDANILSNLPVLGIIGAVIIIVVVMIGIIIKRKKK